MEQREQCWCKANTWNTVNNAGVKPTHGTPWSEPVQRAHLDYRDYVWCNNLTWNIRTP